MASVTYDLNTGAIEALVRSTDGEVGREVRRRGQRVLSRARELAPVKTGTLRASGSMSLGKNAAGEVEATVSFSAKHAIFVHQGTKPHRIQGNPLLSFYWPKVGSQVAFRWVNHPGTKAQPFLLDALEEVMRAE